MNVDLWWYQARALKVSDGDTVWFEIDQGMRSRIEAQIRIAGVNASELFTGADRERAAQARDFLVSWLTERTRDQRWPFLIHTYKLLQADGEKMSFTRYVGDVYDANSGDSLADAIRTAGFDVS